jgi:hypothetical protein
MPKLTSDGGTVDWNTNDDEVMDLILSAPDSFWFHTAYDAGPSEDDCLPSDFSSLIFAPQRYIGIDGNSD